MTVRVRDADAGDVEAVVTLVESAYRGESSRGGWTTEADLLDGQRTDADEIGEAVTAPDVILLLAEDAAGRGQLVGCCQITRRPEELAYFGTFAVRPGEQDRGLGRLLLTAAEERARTEWGCSRMEMTVIAQRAELIAWYERRGYRATGETRPFPYEQVRAGRPKRSDLYFRVLVKELAG